jgi:hypothetical protein
MAVTIPDAAQIETRLKAAIREAENGLIGQGMDARSATTLVEPLDSFAAQIAVEGVWSAEFVLFNSRDTMRCFHIRDLSRDFVTVGDRFLIRPLLPLVSREQRFYMLALSRKYVRLLFCTWRTAKEIPLGALVPQNLDVWLNSRIPDHVLDNRSSAGPSVGSMKGVMFGTNTDRERRDEYLTHFFREIDKGLRKALAGQNIPLLLAGVESEIVLYRKVNTYPHSLEPAVHGSPDGLSPNDLLLRAVEAVRQTFSAPLRKVLQSFKDFRDTSRVSTSISEILKLAPQGRVAHLLIREDADYGGERDGLALTVGNGPILAKAEDLLNLAALLTVSHRGHVFALKAPDMPEETDVAAVLRF